MAVSKSLVVTEYCVVVAVTVLCHVLNLAPVPKELQADLAVKMDSFEKKKSCAKESREDVMDETRLGFPFFFACIILQRITADRL